MYMYIYIYTHIYVHIHIHVHMCTLDKRSGRRPRPESRPRPGSRKDTIQDATQGVAGTSRTIFGTRLLLTGRDSGRDRYSGCGKTCLIYERNIRRDREHEYRGTSLIRNCPPPLDFRRAPDIGLL